MSDEQPDDDRSLGARDLLTLGGFLVACMVLGVLAGLLLDHWLGTAPAFALVGTVLGIVAAGAGFWLRVRSFLRD